MVQHEVTFNLTLITISLARKHSELHHKTLEIFFWFQICGDFNQASNREMTLGFYSMIPAALISWISDSSLQPLYLWFSKIR